MPYVLGSIVYPIYSHINVDTFILGEIFFKNVYWYDKRLFLYYSVCVCLVIFHWPSLMAERKISFSVVDFRDTVQSIWNVLNFKTNDSISSEAKQIIVINEFNLEMKIWLKWILKRSRMNRHFKKKVIYLHLTITTTKKHILRL